MIKLIVGLLIIACIAPLFIRGSDGEPLMTLDDWKIEFPVQLKELIGSLRDGVKKTEPDGEVQRLAVFKWQDDEGQWHFSNAPPNPDLAIEVEIGAVNLVEAYMSPAVTSKNNESPVGQGTGMSSGTPSPAQVQEMMDTVDQYKQSINQRKEALDALTVPGSVQ